MRWWQTGLQPSTRKDKPCTECRRQHNSRWADETARKSRLKEQEPRKNCAKKTLVFDQFYFCMVFFSFQKPTVAKEHSCWIATIFCHMMSLSARGCTAAQDGVSHASTSLEEIWTSHRIWHPLSAYVIHTTWYVNINKFTRIYLQYICTHSWFASHSAAGTFFLLPSLRALWLGCKDPLQAPKVVLEQATFSQKSHPGAIEFSSCALIPRVRCQLTK